LLLYAEGQRYVDDHTVSAEEGLRRRDTPMTALGVSYAEGICLYTDGFMPSAYYRISVVTVEMHFYVFYACSNENSKWSSGSRESY
jgi:hypothetical protein